MGCNKSKHLCAKWLFLFDMRFDRPPLPFVGNKFRWWRQLKPMIEALPERAIVFDAFGGSFAVSKLIKHFRQDCVCICNDCEMYYRNRLENVADTNRVLDEMRANGGYRCNEKYAKYDPETEHKLKEIVATGIDKITLNRALYVNGHTARTKCPTVNYDENECEHWCDDLVVIDECIDERKAKYYCRSCDLIVLDPPYLKSPKSWGIGDYIDKTKEARAFCKSVIERNECDVWLFDTPDSDLMLSAQRRGGEIVPYAGNRNRQGAKECLCVIQAKTKQAPIDNQTQPATRTGNLEQHLQLSLPL